MSAPFRNESPERIADPMTAHIILFLVLSIAIAYLALRFRRLASRSAPVDGIPGFRAEIGFTALDGMQSVSLLLENESSAGIWLEKIEISLADIAATEQTAQPSCHEVLCIRQMVGVRDALSISLAEVIYKAAGGPQREYSCALSSALRFRIGDHWFERQLETYRVRMLGLTASSVRRERTRAPELPRVEEPQSIAAAVGKFK